MARETTAEANGTVAAKDPGMIRTDFAFGLPVAMKAEIELHAQNAGMAPTDFVKQIVAERIGYNLPAPKAKAASGKTKDELKAEQKARDQAARAEAKSALATYRERLGVKVETPDAATATPAPEPEPATA